LFLTGLLSIGQSSCIPRFHGFQKPILTQGNSTHLVTDQSFWTSTLISRDSFSIFGFYYLRYESHVPHSRLAGNFNNIINKNEGMSPNSQRRHQSYYFFNLYFSFSSSASLFNFLMVLPSYN
jgi:hypothetical protein